MSRSFAHVNHLYTTTMCMFTHKLHTCIHQSHKTSLNILIHSFWLHMHITLIKKNLIGKFQSKIYLRLYYFSLRNSMFLSDYDCFPLNVLERKGKRCYFRFCCKFFCLKCPLPNYMLEKPPASYNEVFSVRAKSVKNGLTYVNSRNAFSSMFIITTLSVGVFFSFAAVNILSKFSAFLGLLCKKQN